MAVTIQQLANHAGVSRQTVSAILGKKAKMYRPETQTAVLKAVRDLGYRPNRAARAMVKGRFGAVGILMSTCGRYSVLGQIIEGIQAAASKHNLAIRFCTMPDEEIDDRHIGQLMNELCVDGVLVNYTYHFPPRLTELLEEHRIPAVWTNVQLDHDCVHPDDFGSGAVAMQRLSALGHRDLGYVTFKTDNDVHYSMSDRRDGFVAAAETQGLPVSVLELTPSHHNGNQIARVVRWLREARPTAVHTQSKDEAYLVWLAAERMKLSVPEDLSILTYSYAGAGGPGIKFDSLNIPSHEVGRRGIEMLREKIASPQRRFNRESLPCFISGDCDYSIGPPRDHEL